MADPPRVLIAGGYGVFGRLLARELLAMTPARVVLAGRDPRRAAAACRSLRAPDRTEVRALDLRQAHTLVRAAEDCFAVACTAGPFQQFHPELPLAAVEAGAHWLDISDDPGWVLPLITDTALDAAAASSGLAVIPGLSTVPALSGALVRWCREALPAGCRARVTLFIGNRNPKGTAAIASALGAGWTDPKPVELSVGRCLAYRFPSPDTVLLREELALDVEFRVAFEWPVALRTMKVAARLAQRIGPWSRVRLARWLSLLSAPFSHLGSNVGCLQAELWDECGGSVVASLVGAGQRMAVLPCALAVDALLSGKLHHRGVVRPAAWLDPDEWLVRLQARGVEFTSRVT